MHRHSIQLFSNYKMPLLGFGTFKMRGYELLYEAINAALASGYRSFDTVSVYKNEEDIGKALKVLLPKYNLTRQDIFVTSKLGPSEQGKEKAKAAILGSLSRLGFEYLDLYLIHWPANYKINILTLNRIMPYSI